VDGGEIVETVVVKLLGILLAAGAGTRMGMPKALVRDVAGLPWVVRSVQVLREGGCTEIGVVVGAAADEVAALLASEGVIVVPSPEWMTGMAASLRSGLDWAEGTDATAALVSLVDLPDVGAAVVRRIVAVGGTSESALARAAYVGKPGHPVLLGRTHWAPAKAAATGDRGAGPYLVAAGCRLIPCEDLASGNDVDRPTA
jgi:CTP:molybdopterin cytidylyltransferase MocA